MLKLLTENCIPALVEMESPMVPIPMLQGNSQDKRVCSSSNNDHDESSHLALEMQKLSPVGYINRGDFARAQCAS